MKLTKKRLMEMAGLVSEGSKDRDAIAHFVWGKDELMDKSEQEIEEIVDGLEQEYNASKANYSSVDEYLDELENTGDWQGYISEANGFSSGKQFINTKLQSYPKALAKVNDLIKMIGEPNFTMEMAEWIFDFFNNASYESPVRENKRTNGKG